MSCVVRQELWIEEGRKIDERNIVAGPRINIDYAEEWKGTVRFFFFFVVWARADTRLSPSLVACTIQAAPVPREREPARQQARLLQQQEPLPWRQEGVERTNAFRALTPSTPARVNKLNYNFILFAKDGGREGDGAAVRAGV